MSACKSYTFFSLSIYIENVFCVAYAEICLILYKWRIWLAREKLIWLQHILTAVWNFILIFARECVGMCAFGALFPFNYYFIMNSIFVCCFNCIYIMILIVLYCILYILCMKYTFAVGYLCAVEIIELVGSFDSAVARK